ncbi:MAG: glycogen-binding domain-containing protein [Spirochaetaceae bacterium]|jgi:hypothetical protein|nr:glycogen-binding domain-containing protein [Spirochaetaceae bacterium]
MKKIITLMLLGLIIGNIGAVDTESYQFIDHLLSLTGPGMPEIYEDAVIFTAPSSYRRVGIVFAHEDFSKIYWFRKLMVSVDNPNYSGKSKEPSVIYEDSGILFHVYTVPEDIRELEYRLIIDGLWTVDPLNPLRRPDPRSGLARSLVFLPEISRSHSVFDGPPGSLSFYYNAPPGETITVAGNFNGWDPFMYELRERMPGQYSLTLPLPPGVYQYVFFHRGERVLDPNNSSRVYTREGKTASEAVVR